MLVRLLYKAREREREREGNELRERALPELCRRPEYLVGQ
jgi:hypothetical protein